MSDPSLIEEQTAYYRARVEEYDEWFLRVGRYDRGEQHRRQWTDELETIRTFISSSSPLGDTLEIACGTGLWTGHLAALAASLMALDSVEETIAVNRQKNAASQIDYIVADIFDWEPTHRFDTVFFGFWLSHVPPSHFEKFWAKVGNALKPQGKVIFADSLKAQRSTASDHHPLNDSGVVERRLNSGETFRIVKRFYEPRNLLTTLKEIGWDGVIHSTDEFFLYGAVQQSNKGERRS
ncbi:MAG: class I SAM-dependent methyltransferase [Verrucomicrobiae bacterium]|nr:class I SAM-dependent methyltransferase [Verrucomicrobiae bacterium]